MTRLMTLIAAAMLTSTTAVAAPTSSMSENFHLADAPPVEMSADAFIRADMSFMDAMRMISTITLPDLSAQPDLSSSGQLRIRRVAYGWTDGKVVHTGSYTL